MLEMKLSAKEQKTTSFIVFDCTGSYSFNNKGGYGIPNNKLEEMTDSFLEIQPPSSTVKYPFKINTFSEYPNTDEVGYEILPYQVGMAEIESGEWKIKQTVVFENSKKGKSIKTAYLSVIFINSVACCIDKRSPKVLPGGYNDPKQKLIIELSNLLETVKGQIECGLNGQANKNIEYMKSQCKCCECS